MSTSRVWFRGQADATWPLLPTALRESFLDAAEAWVGKHPSETTRILQTPLGIERPRAGLTLERMANDRFRREAAPLLSSAEDLRTVYMEARHAGLPSRLLDWTTRPLIALFFACMAEQDSDGTIFVFDAVGEYYYFTATNDQEFQEESTLTRAPTPVVDTHVAFSGQIPRMFGDFPEMASFPSPGPVEGSVGGVLPVLPTHRISKLAAQHSCFTFHPYGFDKNIKEEHLLERFKVPAADKKQAIAQLRLLGIDESAIWPDLDGTARAIMGSLGLP